MTRTTDADNLNWYLYLFEYNDTSRIPYKALAKRLGTSQHSLIAKVGRARKHPTMAEALIQQGLIAEEQLPPWAAKPRAHILAAAAAIAKDAETLTNTAYTPDIQPPSNRSQVAQVSASASPLASATPPATEPKPQPYLGTVQDSSQTLHFETLDGKANYSNGPYSPPSRIQRMSAQISTEIERDIIEGNHTRKLDKKKDRKDREFVKNNQWRIILAQAQVQKYQMPAFAMMNASRTPSQATKTDVKEFTEIVSKAFQTTPEIKPPTEPPPPKPQKKPRKYEPIKQPSYTQHDQINELTEIKRKHDIKMSTTYKRTYPRDSMMALFDGRKHINPDLESLIRKADKMRESVTDFLREFIK